MKIDFSSELDSRRWLPILALLLAVVVCVIVYWPGLNGPMLMDDFPQLGRFFHGGSNHALTLKRALWSNSGLFGRPVSMLTFWLNSLITPDNLFAWKLTNLIIHCFAALFAGLLAMELFGEVHRNYAIEPRYLGGFVGIVWLLHPLQVSTVLYTVQRMAELSALFSFAGLYFYVRARRGHSAARLTRTIHGLAALSVATVFATLSKENGLLLPFLALAIEFLIFQGNGSRVTSRALKIYFGAVCLLSAVAVVLLFTIDPGFIFGGYAFRDFTLGQRLLSEPRILFDYLNMLLVPTPGNMGFFHDDFVLSGNALHPVTTLPSIAGLVLLTASAWIMRRRFPLYALGIAIFLIGQSMESSIFALEPMFEHRNYLPSFGIILGMTDLGSWVVARWPGKLTAAAAGTILLTLTVLLAVRISHWSSNLSFYRAAVATHPASDAAVAGLAQLYLDNGNPRVALTILSAKHDIGAQLQRAYIECKIAGKLSTARLQQLADQPIGFLNSYPVTGLTTLGTLGIQNKCRFPATAYSRLIDRAARMNSTRPSLRYMLYIYSGYYHKRLHQLNQAIAAMQAAHRMSPATPVPLILSARWYLQAGDVSRAQTAVDQAQHIDHGNQDLFSGDISKLQTKIQKAAVQLQQH